MHTLLTWLGTKDIENMLVYAPAAICTIAIKSTVPFDNIIPLSNKDEDKWSNSRYSGL
jgi:hypothetical protein